MDKTRDELGIHIRGGTLGSQISFPEQIKGF